MVVALDGMIPDDVFPITIPGMWNQNLGFLDLGNGTWVVLGKPSPKITGSIIVEVLTTPDFEPIADPREIETGLELVHDPRPFFYPDGRVGIMLACQSSKQLRAHHSAKPGSHERWQRTWGQAHSPFGPGVMTSIKNWTIWPGDLQTLGHKNFIPYANTTISHPGRGELWGWGDDKPSQFSPALPLELRGGSLPLDIPGTPYALCSYHAVHVGPSGRKVYTAWLGLITKAWPHGVQAYWKVNTTYLLDLQPEVLNGSLRFVESVVFPMALRRRHDNYEILMGVQDGACYGVVIAAARIDAVIKERVGHRAGIVSRGETMPASTSGHE